MILLRLPISYQLVIVININVDINYQNRLLSISMRYQLSEHSLINFNININIAIFAYQYFLINALSSSGLKSLFQLRTMRTLVPLDFGWKTTTKILLTLAAAGMLTNTAFLSLKWFHSLPSRLKASISSSCEDQTTITT